MTRRPDTSGASDGAEAVAGSGAPGAAGSTVAVGIDIGGTKLLGVRIDPDAPGTILQECRVPTPAGPDALLDAIVAAVAQLDPQGTASVGVGIPGMVDHEDRFRAGPNLPGVVDLPVGERLSARLGRSVAVDNDATCATVAEFAVGAGAGHGDGVLLTIGTGIGGGVVLGGAIRRGASGFAGEFGHMLIDPHGPPCPCGRHGCWERYGSGSGLARLGRDAAVGGALHAAVALAGGSPEDVRGEHVVAAARAGDAQAGAVLDAFAGWLGAGIADLILALDPAIVVLGGGVMESADVLLERIRAAVPANLGTAPQYRAVPPVMPAMLGEHAGAIGAALTGLPHL